VPSHFRRKQTVANGERYTTDELDELQGKILHAEDLARALEQEIFEDLRARTGAHAARLRGLATWLAEVDVHASLAELAHRHGYVRPDIDETLGIELCECRHPIVETLAAAGAFVPNDVSVDAEAARLLVITGPNMAGKSTTMREVALAVVMAQMGSFVAATTARIGLVDRVFTRVGASDDLSRGQSTFMVEMRETATILREATRRSLVILDEVGRGTSTFDGLAIAWAVAEHLHDVVGCRTLFATHYHELCELAERRAGVRNWNVAAREQAGDIVFLHRLLPGGSSRSYGVAVARLAGVPEAVTMRARDLLEGLERDRSSASRGEASGSLQGSRAADGMPGARSVDALSLSDGARRPQAPIHEAVRFLSTLDVREDDATRRAADPREAARDGRLKRRRLAATVRGSACFAVHRRGG
jgi:DNA mismatch repair protein MutS